MICIHKYLTVFLFCFIVKKKYIYIYIYSDSINFPDERGGSSLPLALWINDLSRPLKNLKKESTLSIWKKKEEKKSFLIFQHRIKCIFSRNDLFVKLCEATTITKTDNDRNFSVCRFGGSQAARTSFNVTGLAGRLPPNRQKDQFLPLLLLHSSELDKEDFPSKCASCPVSSH